MPRLENWSVIVGNTSPYTPPELLTKHLHGRVYGDGRFPDGTNIKTSAILRTEQEVVLTHSGTRYTLGEIDPKYEAKFPGARKRLLAPAAECGHASEESGSKVSEERE